MKDRIKVSPIHYHVETDRISNHIVPSPNGLVVRHRKAFSSQEVKVSSKLRSSLLLTTLLFNLPRSLCCSDHTCDC